MDTEWVYVYLAYVTLGTHEGEKERKNSLQNENNSALHCIACA